MLKILGLDPGLGTTGWGLIQAEGNRLVPHRQWPAEDRTPPSRCRRGSRISPSQLEALLAEHRPEGAAVEEVFVNKNPQSTLKLGQARGVVLMLRRALRARPSANMPRGWSRKPWSAPAMPKRRRSTRWSRGCFPACQIAGPDAADALAVAITHAHHLASARRITLSFGRDDRPPHRNPRRNQRRRRRDRCRRGRLSGAAPAPARSTRSARSAARCCS